MIKNKILGMSYLRITFVNEVISQIFLENPTFNEGI